MDSSLDTETWLEPVRQRLAVIRFGTIQLVVHEGRVTQVDATERLRLPRD